MVPYVDCGGFLATNNLLFPQIKEQTSDIQEAEQEAIPEEAPTDIVEQSPEPEQEQSIEPKVEVQEEQSPEPKVEEQVDETQQQKVEVQDDSEDTPMETVDGLFPLNIKLFAVAIRIDCQMTMSVVLHDSLLMFYNFSEVVEVSVPEKGKPETINLDEIADDPVRYCNI